MSSNTDPIVAHIQRIVDDRIAAVRVPALAWVHWRDVPGMRTPRHARRWADREGIRCSHVGRELVLDRAQVQSVIERDILTADPANDAAPAEAPKVSPKIAAAFKAAK